MNNMKKKLSVLLAIVIVLTSLIIPVSADTAGSTPDGAYINTGGTLYPVTKGDTYTYEYRLNLGKKLTAIDASLSYDTAGLELVNYTFPILGSSANAGTYGGKLYFNYSFATGIEFSGSSAVLIRATFKVKAENGTFDVHTDIMDMSRYQEVKIVENGTVISSFTHNELITDDDSKTSIYIKTGNKYYKVKRGKTYHYICYLKTSELVGNLVANTYYDSYGLSTSSSTRTTYQSYSGKSFAEDNTVLVSIPFTVKSNAYDNTTYSISTSISKLQDINEDTISRYTITEVIEGLSYVTHDPNEPPTEPEPETTLPEPTEAPPEPTECGHWRTYTREENLQYFTDGYNICGYDYELVTYCSDCGEELSRAEGTKYYPTEPPVEPTEPEPTEPVPEPTEPPWDPPTEFYCDHYWYGTYTENADYRYYDWGYTYNTYTYCSNCGQELSVTAGEVHYADKSKCLNFDNSLTNWQGPVKFYVYEVGGSEQVAWGSKGLNGTDNGDGTWSYDPSTYMELVPGKQYAIIFVDSDTGAQTYDLLFDTTCLGDTAYVNPDKRIENPYDSNKSTMEARWRNSNMGPMLQITSIGNVVGETVPSNTTPYAMLVDFLRNTLNNARDYTHRSDQQILDDTAKALELNDDDVSKAIKEAGVTVSWQPTQITPTEPPTDSYGYTVGGYYLIGSVNGDNSGIGNVHKNLRFEQGDTDYTLSYVKLSKGDKVNVAVYRGNNVFIIYPDGTGQEKSIDKSGYYTFYFKPYEIGNPNYWYFNSPSFVGDIVGGILGDADGNGNIEVTDATFIRRWLVKIDTPYTKAELMRGDVDGSGDLEIFDVTAIQYYLANMKTQFPIGQTIS